MTPPLRHEVMHLLSGRLWGPPALMWMAEGTGTLITRECGGQELGAIAAELSREGRLVPLDTLWHHFNAGWETGAIYSIEAASLIDYIERVYGRAQLRALWQADRDDQIERILGVHVATLEREWRATVTRSTPSPPWTEVFRRIAVAGCR